MGVANSGSVGRGKEDVKPFELIIGEAGGEVMNGDVPVRWCVTPALVADMEAAGINDPHILLISYKKNTDIEMDRKLVPITEIMTYVRFTRAGEMTLASWIVSSDAPKNRVRLKNVFLKRDNDYTYYNDDNNEVPKTIITDYSYTYCHVDVNIPEGAFAKEPPKWLKWFGNLWYDSRPVDQCNFRQRLLLAFTLKWMPMLAWIVLMTAMKAIMSVMLTACGWYRAPNYKHFLHPFEAPIAYFIDTDEIKINDHPFLIDVKWDRAYPYHEQSLTFAMPLIPIFPMVIFGIVTLAAGFGAAIGVTLFFLGMAMLMFGVWDILTTYQHYFYGKDTHIGTKLYNKWHAVDVKLTEMDAWPNVLMVLGVGLVALFIWLAITSFIFQIALATFGIGAAFIFGSFWLGERMVNKQVEKNDYTQIRELLCPRDPLNTSAEYELVPPEQRTVHLWVAKVKNKICKPMQY